MNTRARTTGWITITAAATALLGLGFGVRAVLGMFISPLNSATGLGFAAISLALAASQLVSGFAQPLCGAFADRHGPARVVFAGGLLLAGGLAMLPAVSGMTGLVLAFCVIAIAYAAVGSTPTLLAAVTRVVPEAHRGLASGIVSAGGSVGQLVIAPATQLGIAALGWAGATFGLAVLSLAALPASRAFLAARPDGIGADAAPENPAGRTRIAIRTAFGSPKYWLICAGFFVCGFHVSFLIAHMPGVIELCGLPSQLTGIWLGVLGISNVAGGIVSGLSLRRLAMARTLSVVYALRALGVVLFVLAPKTQAVLLGFAVWMGFTYMATLPPTSGLVGKLFGTRHLGSLFGVVMLVHQLGSFFGVWLGGVVLAVTGSYDWLWRADIALALLAALIHLPIREAHRQHPGAGALSGQPA